ncbi:MAG: 23S rRNA (adenine(2030)-N(6))-methyltransferase RlmJ [Zetaproteobacteria bacterium CG2_30_46_52]|nr:MAG: 23S rRNA (adenine(2030)-N(6))-methyltransferase RlmJ [Zetaproteobacteria bacterium CG2_30_46_52]
MLSYQHTYHAGNHADVLKHIILGDILAGMQAKDKPLFLLDAFASRGVYDLSSAHALKTNEAETGVRKLWPLRHERSPMGVHRWFLHTQAQNSEGGLTYYPGSTSVLHHLQRDNDRLVACDLHPQEFDDLNHQFSRLHGVAVLKRDAFEAIKALVPPPEKRGLIFIDPSYEIKDEYTQVAKTVAQAHKRFANGVYVIWYPMLPEERHITLLRSLKNSGIRKIFRVELDTKDCFPDLQMHGSGLLIINPPWNAQQAMKSSLDWVCDKLTDNKGEKHMGWLVPE